MPRLTEQELEAIRQHCIKQDRVSPLPITSEPTIKGSRYYVYGGDGAVIASSGYRVEAEWLVSSRVYVPQLLAHIVALLAEMERQREALRQVYDCAAALQDVDQAGLADRIRVIIEPILFESEGNDV